VNSSATPKECSLATDVLYSDNSVHYRRGYSDPLSTHVPGPVSCSLANPVLSSAPNASPYLSAYVGLRPPQALLTACGSLTTDSLLSSSVVSSPYVSACVGLSSTHAMLTASDSLNTGSVLSSAAEAPSYLSGCVAMPPTHAPGTACGSLTTDSLLCSSVVSSPYVSACVGSSAHALPTTFESLNTNSVFSSTADASPYLSACVGLPSTRGLLTTNSMVTSIANIDRSNPLESIDPTVVTSSTFDTIKTSWATTVQRRKNAVYLRDPVRYRSAKAHFRRHSRSHSVASRRLQSARCRSSGLDNSLAQCA
jgi:hypothetical protein